MGQDAKFVVRLEPEERVEMQKLLERQKGARTARQRAKILWKVDQTDGAPAWSDEQSKPLIGETRTPIPATPGHPEREDYEYQRNGTANLFMAFEPLGGQRHVQVTARRTPRDFADVVRDLVDTHSPHAEKIVWVLDNWKTHKIGSL